MADLGEFGRARAIEKQGDQPKPDTFTFHGEQFEIPAAISVVVLMDFVADQRAAQQDREDAIAAEDDVALITASNVLMTCLRDYCRSCLGEERHWRRFNGVCRRDAVDIDELMEVCAAIYSAVAVRPTRRPSDSSGGPSTTGDGSTDVSASPEPTPGQTVQGEVLGEVVQLESAAQRQQREMRSLMTPVDDLLGIRSGG